jgi:hypothetical protein
VDNKHRIKKYDEGLYYCELEKVTSVHNNVRTDKMIGATYDLPRLNNDFVIFGESLTPVGAFRQIHTTRVVSIEENPDCIEFRTKNSTYRLRGIDDRDLCEKLSELSIFKVGHSSRADVT